MEPEPLGAASFCLEPEPTQVGRSRLRDTVRIMSEMKLFLLSESFLLWWRWRPLFELCSVWYLSLQRRHKICRESTSGVFFFVTQALQQSGLRSCVVAAEVAVEVVVKSVQVALKLIKNLL